MQTTAKKIDKQLNQSSNKSIKEKSNDESSPKPRDDKLKKTPYTIITPRNFVQKTTTADIYGQKKKTAVHNANAPKKPPSASYLSSNPSPMKGLLKSSPSSSSQISTTSRDSNAKISSQRKVEARTYSVTPRKKDFNVTVNSPIVKRKLNMEREKSYVKEVGTERLTREPHGQRERTKTRTLDENEVKVLTSNAVDNNAEMINLAKKLVAKPKAFYIDLDTEKSIKVRPVKPISHPEKPSSEDEVSYEDDFESYESDFDSYHSSSLDVDNVGDQDSRGDDELEPETAKDFKDDERMLDSGNFDLREQQSAKSKPAVMEFITEASEDASEDKKVSLTDEGFQELSSSSAVSSMPTVHADVLDRPLFIDFNKSKENKRKKRLNDRLKQRAKDLLSIITLHEMTYNLFEMKPISYDLYMATFGRANYTQIAVQTFEDGITEEVQTDDFECEEKWTQHPVEFSNNDVCVRKQVEKRKYSENTEDYLTKFTFLTKQTTDVELNNVINLDANYKANPLRVYLEQKDGVGPNAMLSHEKYNSKLVDKNYNSHRLKRFLKRVESRISQVLNKNKGNTELTNLQASTLPFSEGYICLSTKNMGSEFLFLKNTKILQIYFSETKSSLVMTVHKKSLYASSNDCVICLWDISVVTREPVKILNAIDDVVIGRFRGGTDGFFVAALKDGSIHLWDLSEPQTWRNGVVNKEKYPEVAEINTKGQDAEEGKEMYRKNSQVGFEQSDVPCAVQACAYTSSAFNMSNGYAIDQIVGLELASESSVVTHDGGRKIVGQVISLQRIGILTIWTIVQDKYKNQEIGKAFNSKMKLEINQTIYLLNYIDAPSIGERNGEKQVNFNLNAAKRRLSSRKRERINLQDISRPKSAVSSDYDFYIDRPTSAASTRKKVLPPEKDVLEKWESGIVCYDLKIMLWRNCCYYLVAKNCGEVLFCTKNIGATKVDILSVSTDMSPVTCLVASPHGLPYFLAATETGTVNICSLLDKRVLLTLDCRNAPVTDMERCQADHKGRFVSTQATKQMTPHAGSPASVTSLSWCHVDPCRLFATLHDGALVGWQLTHSDINAKCRVNNAACACAPADNTLALLTPDGEVQMHRLTNELRTKEYLLIFEKYIALL